MNENYQKTGLAAFVLSVAAIVSLGLAVIPALICAVISKRQSESAGVPTDGFATAAIVISGFILALWGLALLGGSAVLLATLSSGRLVIPNLSESTVLALLIGSAVATLLVAAPMFLRRRSRLRMDRSRMRRLAGLVRKASA